MACGTKTVECFAEELVLYLDESQLKKLLGIQDTLQKMKESENVKHSLNYWKVMQCLGEIATEKLISIHLSAKFQLSTTCISTVNTYRLTVMQVFIELMASVSVIKRILTKKDEVVRVFFETLRQTLKQNMFQEFVRFSLIGMYRLMIVGKNEICDLYRKRGLLRDCYDQVKSRRNDFVSSPIQVVVYCTKLLLGMADLGDKSIRCQIKHSAVIPVIREYCRIAQMSEVIDPSGYMIAELTTALTQNYGSLGMLLSEDRLPLGPNWKTKEKLKEELKVNYFLIFCSSPACRKQCFENEQFRYCGACKLARYCSQTCQKEHWKSTHKEKCLKQN